MPRALFLPDATQDLLEIWHHIRAWSQGPAAADRLLEAVRSSSQRYASFPELGQLRPDLAPNVRCFSVKSIVVLYVAADDGIEVVQVIHGARDLSARFRR